MTRTVKGQFGMRDLTGQRFGRLSVRFESDRRTSDGCVVWVCLCDCKRYVNVKGRHLVTAATKSCGCVQAETLARGRAIRLGLLREASCNAT